MILSILKVIKLPQGSGGARNLSRSNLLNISTSRAQQRRYCLPQVSPPPPTTSKLKIWLIAWSVPEAPCHSSPLDPCGQQEINGEKAVCVTLIKVFMLFLYLSYSFLVIPKNKIKWYMHKAEGEYLKCKSKISILRFWVSDEPS